MQSDIDFLIELNRQKRTEPPPKLISGYVEHKRVLPPDSPFPGPVDLSITEFAREIIDCLSPYSPTQEVAIMSAAQVVKTFIMENVILYYIGAVPSPILFCSGTDALLDKWWKKRFEPAVDSMDLRKFFTSTIDTTKTRQTGDTGQQKLFHGGFVERASAQSPSSMRADSVKILLLDECDAAPPELTTGEGRWWKVIKARTKAWGSRKKILACSTPVDFQTSAIYEMFLQGDQCELFVPCPHCQEFQLLEHTNDNQDYGIKLVDNRAVYICKHCKAIIQEYHKLYMIKNGKWVPQAKPEENKRSFHINSLLAPFGGFSWMEWYIEAQRAQETPEDLKSFTNLQRGLPFIDQGTRPKPEKIMENRGKYKKGTVPEGVLYITIGADVQRGSKTNPDNPPRIELEVLGIGYAYKTWSIDYLVFEGKVDDPFSGAWEELWQWADDTKLQFKREIDGFRFQACPIFIDSGDGMTTDIVYTFCNRITNAYPIKGQRVISRDKRGVGDELTETSFIPFRASKIDDGIQLYTISTVYYKNKLYSNLKVQRQPQEPQRPGFCDFPGGYEQNYFDMLTAEEKMRDGSFESHGRRNESLDCRVYALCAADVYLYNEVLIYKDWAKRNKKPWGYINSIKSRTVIDQMAKSTEVKK